MEEMLKYKKVLLLLVAIVIVAGLFFGSRAVASYYFNQGIAELNSGNYEQAGQLFNRSLALTFYAKNPEAHAYLGRIALGKVDPNGRLLYPNADYNEAVSHYERALASGIESKNQDLYSIVLNNLGFSYWMLKENDKADGEFLKMIDNFPQKSYIARYFVALDYFDRLNKPQEALDILLPAPDLAVSGINKKNLFHVYTLLGRLSFYFNNSDNVRKYAKLSVDNAGGAAELDVQIAHSLLALIAGINKDFTTAKSEIAKAETLANSKNAYDCILADSYYLGKNYSKAITIAKAKNPSNNYVYSICLQVLADSFFNNGQTSDAKVYMEKYLSLTDTFSSRNIFTERNRQKFSDELKALK